MEKSNTRQLAYLLQRRSNLEHFFNGFSLFANLVSLSRSSITVRSVHRRCRFAFEERSVRLCWLVIGKPGSGHGLSRDSAAWGLEGRRNPLGKKHENRARAFLLDFTRAPTIGSCRRVTTAAQPSFLIYIRTLEYKGKLLHNSCCSIRRDLVATCSSR